MNTQSLYTSFIGKLLALIVLALFAWGNAWAKDVKTNLVSDYNENVTIKANVEVPENKKITITGNLTIDKDKTLVVKGDLIVTGNVTINGTIDLQGGILRVGEFKRKADGSYDLDANGNYQLKSGGNVTLNSESLLQFSRNNSFVEIRNNLTENAGASIFVKEGISGGLYVYNVYKDYVGVEGNPWGLYYTIDEEQKWAGGVKTITKDVNFLKNNSEFDLAVKSYSPNGRSYTDFAGGGSILGAFIRWLIESFIGTDEITDEAKAKLQNLVTELSQNGYDKIKLNEYIAEVSSLLPIELTSFSASQNGDEIEIAWTTNSEVNNDYFTVEYSTNGVSFKTLEIVQGNGTTSEVNEYAITTEASQFNGLVYFRLKQTDYNGEYSYSDVITLMVESSNELYVYPNPATEFVSVSGMYKTAAVQDMFGKKVAFATNDEQIYVGNLSAGMYYVVITTENGKKVLSFVKE